MKLSSIILLGGAAWLTQAAQASSGWKTCTYGDLGKADVVFQTIEEQQRQGLAGAVDVEKARLVLLDVKLCTGTYPLARYCGDKKASLRTIDIEFDRLRRRGENITPADLIYELSGWMDYHQTCGQT